MIEAWFSASEMTASSGPSRGSNRPPLASKQAAKRMLSSWPRYCGRGGFPASGGVLRAADEADRGHAEAVVVHRGLGGGDQAGVVGQAEVVVGAEVQHLPPGHLHMRALRPGDQAFAFHQALGLDARSVAVMWSRKAVLSVMAESFPVWRKLADCQLGGQCVNLTDLLIRHGGSGNQLSCTIRMARAMPSAAISCGRSAG
jgi:hypothetical protein